jgi:ribosomal protein S11
MFFFVFFQFYKFKTTFSFTSSHNVVHPTSITHSQYMVNGQIYKDIPIIHIKATKNNTIISLTDSRGKVLFGTSAVS